MKDHCSDPHENLCWLDLETTGLDAGIDVILEVGIIITTKNLDLEPVNKMSWVVGVPRHVAPRNIDPYVWAMHQDNGLWAESTKSDRDIRDVSLEAAEFIVKNKAAGSPLCGNTINFDRSFLKAQTHLLQCLHYRNIDVSTLKNVMAMHFPDISPFEKPKGKHRVIADLEACIAEYSYYLGLMQTGMP